MAGGTSNRGRHEKPSITVDNADVPNGPSTSTGKARLCAVALLALALISAVVLAAFVFQDTAATEDGTGMAWGFTLLFFVPPWLIGTVLTAVSLGLLVWRPRKMGGYVVGCVLAALAIGVPLLATVAQFSMILIFTRFGWVVMLWGALLLAALVTAQVTEWSSPSEDAASHE
jgi:hypothetical protein